MPSPARTMPLAGLPVPGTICPIRAAVPAPMSAPVSGFIAWRVVSHGNTPPGHPGWYWAGAADAIVALQEEVRGLAVGVVLGHLVREPQAVIERQVAVHLPVVLHVGLDLVVDELAFHERGLLRVRGEHAERRVGEAEPGIERVVRVVGEAQIALERQRVALVQVLLLQAVIAVEADLRRVRAEDLRQADRDVLRRVGVEERRVREGSAAACRCGCPTGTSAPAGRGRPEKNGGATSSITCWLYEPSGRMFASGNSSGAPTARC